MRHTYLSTHRQPSLAPMIGEEPIWRPYIHPANPTWEPTNYWSLNDHIPPTEILWLCLHMSFFPFIRILYEFQGSIVKFTMRNSHGCITRICFCVVFCFPAKIHSNEKVTRFTHGTLCSEIRIQSKGWQRFSSTSHDPRFLVLSDLFWRKKIQKQTGEIVEMLRIWIHIMWTRTSSMSFS